MRIATLYNGEGGFVARVEVPPFTTGMPVVLIWGSRVFLRDGDLESVEYHEVFAYDAQRVVSLPS